MNAWLMKYEDAIGAWLTMAGIVLFLATVVFAGPSYIKAFGWL